MMKELLAIGLILFAWNPKPAEAKDDIRIVSLSPPTDKPLRAGDSVTFEIKVQIEVDPSAGMRRLYIGAYRGRERTDILMAWTEIVPAGKNTLTFKGIARVPATGQISVLATISDATVLGLGKRALSYDAKDYSVVDAAGKKINGTTPRKDTVTITSVSPAAGSTLKTGDSVTFDSRPTTTSEVQRQDALSWDSRVAATCKPSLRQSRFGEEKGNSHSTDRVAANGTRTRSRTDRIRSSPP